ncbi:T9SS type A sorting domain-containing protein [bacterium]|nr:T9SS type A sorting domain-containing protein [bacterium]
MSEASAKACNTVLKSLFNKCCLGLYLISLFSAMPVRAATFGETGTGSTYIYEMLGRVRATQFVCGDTGWINQIRMYISNPAIAEARVAIYAAGNTDLPGALLAESSSQALTPGWNSFNIPYVRVDSGNIYWLAMQTNSDGVWLQVYLGDSNLNRSRGVDWTFGYFPSPDFPPPVYQWDRRMCIYATLAGMTPTPTYTPTITLTATPTFTATNTPTTTPTPVNLTVTLTQTMQITAGNYPGSDVLYLSHNAFRPGQAEVVIINYILRSNQTIGIKVYNVLGEPVKTLFNQPQTAGSRRIVSWNGRDEADRICPAGLYFIQLHTSSNQIRKKIILIK